MAAILRFLFRSPQNSTRPNPPNSGLVVDDRDPFSLARQTYFGPFFLLRDNATTTSDALGIRNEGVPSPATVQLLWSALGNGSELTENEMRTLSGIFTEQMAPPDILPTTTLQALVTIHKNSVKLIPQSNTESNTESEQPTPSTSNVKYSLQFEFDAVVPCQIRIYQSCKELTFIESDSSKSTVFNTSVELKETMPTPTITGPFPTGLRQTFVTPPNFSIDSSHIIPEETQIDERIPQVVVINDTFSTQTTDNTPNKSNQGKTFPLIIVIESLEGFENENERSNMLPCASQCTYVTLSMSDCGLQAQVVKQKIMIEGVWYLVQEIFGFTESTNNPQEPTLLENSLSPEDSNPTRECVVCLSEPKDTIALPCRHLCLCTTCASVLRLQGRSPSNPSSYNSRPLVPKCPICRQPFHALLKITENNQRQLNRRDSITSIRSQRSVLRLKAMDLI